MSEATVTLLHKFKEINPSAKDIERFWSKVDKRGEDECWEWKDHKDRGGYGKIWLSGRNVLAHRFAWVIANGKMPDGLFACHKCDNPACCNPNHLFAGTSQDNIDDRVRKGRSACGDRNASRLYPEKRERGENHWTRRNPEKAARGDRNGARLHPEKLARGANHWVNKYPELLCRGDNHWTKAMPDKTLKGEGHGMAVLNTESVRLIRFVWGNGGYSKAALGRIFGVTSTNIFDIVNNKTWRHI
jgi:hypothetical protein